MTERTNRRLDALASSAIFLLACLALGYAVFMMSGCAGSTSEITPAESAAAEKSYRLTGESAKRSTSRIIISRVAPVAPVDSSEEK